MRKQMLFAAVAGLTLVSAHPPTEATGPIEARYDYPPCSRTITDRCIQTYERGVRAQTAAHVAQPGMPAPAPVRVAVDEDEDIDVAYAGEVLQAPRAGHHPAMHGPDHAGMPPPPPRVIVIREQRRAHAVTPQAIAMAEAPRHYPACAAGVTDRCSQHRARPGHRQNRQVAMRVRRAGERG